MAYIRRLPSGRFQATVRHPSGRKITKTYPLKRTAQAWADAKEHELRNADVPLERGRAMTLRDWHDRWIQARNVAATTAHEEQLRLNKYVLPQWGTWPLRSITRMDVQTWVTKLGRDRGPNVTAGCYHLLNKLLADAELEGLIAATPCRKIELPKIQKPAPRWLTREEYGRLLLAFDAKADGSPVPQGAQWKAMVAVACHSGLRSGELAGLDVGHVDFDRHQIHVQQVMTKFGLRDYPKSDSSRRTAPVHPDALELLWPIVADKSSDAACFPAPRGGRLDQSNFLKTVWHPALERAGIESVRAYVTRHTFASWLVQDGVPLWDIAQALGHGSLDFVNRYAFLQPGAHESIRAAWSRASGVRAAHGSDRLESTNGKLAAQADEMAGQNENH